MTYIRDVKTNEITDKWHNAFLDGFNAALEELEIARTSLEPQTKVDATYDENCIDGLKKIIKEISENAIDACILRMQLTLKQIRLAMAEEEEEKEVLK